MLEESRIPRRGERQLHWPRQGPEDIVRVQLFLMLLLPSPRLLLPLLLPELLDALAEGGARLLERLPLQEVLGGIHHGGDGPAARAFATPSGGSPQAEKRDILRWEMAPLPFGVLLRRYAAY